MAKKLTPLERQILDKAVAMTHTDKKQVDEILKMLSGDMQEKYLDELRRRGGDEYPERGPNTKGSDIKIESIKKALKRLTGNDED